MLDGLPWFTRERASIACHPAERFPWARSIISLAVPYHTAGSYSALGSSPPPHGRLARFAAGEDYHLAIGRRLSQLEQALAGLKPGTRARGYVDTGPLPERAIAARAGIGFFGKSANLIVLGHGSWVFLAELLTSLELAPDEPQSRGCGRCTKCLEACPTGALVAPYTVDSNRCISFLTIELRGSVPMALRPKIGDWWFGCDVCQAVCPINARYRASSPVASESIEPPALALAPIFELDEIGFRARFRRSALWRAKRSGLQRNAAIVLGNTRDPAAVPILSRALRQCEPLVQGHAAWALGAIGGRLARAGLEAARRGEREPAVVAEIAAALAQL